MATFSSWLSDQIKREDQVGWVARYWKDLSDKPRLSSPVSIEGHLRQRGLFESQDGLADAWTVVTGEYRQGRLVAAAADAGVTTEQLAASIERHPSGHDYAQDPLPGMDGQQADVRPAPVTLEILDAKLDAICIRLGITIPAGTITAGMLGPDLAPIDWAALHAETQTAAGE